MRKPDPQVIRALAVAVNNNPAIIEWLTTALESEVKRLPYAVEHTAIYQGRCQMLTEVIDFLHQTPDLAAKSR